MSDPVTIGTFAAFALSVGAQAAIKGFVGEAAKNAYKALKAQVAQWAAHDVDALEKDPDSGARRAVMAEVIDRQSASELAELRALADKMISALKGSEGIGLEVGRLEAMSVTLGNIDVASGTGVRIGKARVQGDFTTGDVSVGRAPGKS